MLISPYHKKITAMPLHVRTHKYCVNLIIKIIERGGLCLEEPTLTGLKEQPHIGFCIYSIFY
jgi:hypothetical protein